MKVSELKAFLDSVLETGVDPDVHLVMEADNNQYEDDLAETAVVKSYKNGDFTEGEIRAVKLVGSDFDWGCNGDSKE